MVGISANTGIQLPSDFYPKDNGKWTVKVVDATTASKTKVVSIVCTMIDRPIAKEVGAVATIPISHTSKGPDYWLLRALLEAYPEAKTPLDIYKLQANFARVYRAWTFTKPVKAPQ
eukprot:1476171-Rhodomonas_salina.1